MDLDDINPIAVLLALFAFGIGVYTSKGMGASVGLRIFYGIVIAIVGYFVSNWIINSG